LAVLTEERGGVGSADGGGVEGAAGADVGEGGVRGTFGFLEGPFEEGDDLGGEGAALGFGALFEAFVEVFGDVTNV
jgi:hypothetical protein